MIQKLIHKHALSRHPWRKVQINELTELYTSMSVRSLGFGLVGVFIPIFLYDNGVSLTHILGFYAFFFGLRLPLSFLAAYIVGRVGPKHTIAISTVITATFLCMLLSFPSVQWPLAFMAFTYTLANTLFFTAYHIDFSKIQHSTHGGKELGWMIIFEQIGRGVGPVVGGILAGVVAPQATLVIAIGVLAASLVPLFMTNEPVKVHQKISFRGFKQTPFVRDFVAIGALNVQVVIMGLFWPLLIAIAVFSENTYEKLGVLTGITVAISIFSTRMYGKFIDSNKGGALMKWGVVMNVFMTNAMAITTGVGGVVAASTLGQPALLAYRMPLSKGMYDNASINDKHRILYIVWMEIYAGLAKFFFVLGAYVASIYFDPVLVMRFSIVLGGLTGLLMLVQNFPALKEKAPSDTPQKP